MVGTIRRKEGAYWGGALLLAALVANYPRSSTWCWSAYPAASALILFDTPDEHLAVYLLALIFCRSWCLKTSGLLKIRMEERGLQYSCFVILLKALTLVFTVLLFLTYEKSAFRSAIYAIAAAGDRHRGWHCSCFFPAACRC